MVKTDGGRSPLAFQRVLGHVVCYAPSNLIVFFCHSRLVAPPEFLLLFPFSLLDNSVSVVGDEMVPVECIGDAPMN